jgi:hypothetical protein
MLHRRWRPHRRGLQARRFGPPEQVTLTERGPERQRLFEVLFGLDALGEQDGPGPFVVGENGGQRPGLIVTGVRLDHLQVEFDDVRTDDVEERQRIRMGANVVEGDRETVCAQGGDLAQQRVRMLQQVALGQLEHQSKLVVRAGQRRILGPFDVQAGRFAVDHQERAAHQAEIERGVDGQVDGQFVEVIESAGPLGVSEDRLRDGVAQSGPSGERLEPHDDTVGERDHGLKCRRESDSRRSGVEDVGSRMTPTAGLAKRLVVPHVGQRDPLCRRRPRIQTF